MRFCTAAMTLCACAASAATAFEGTVSLLPEEGPPIAVASLASSDGAFRLEWDDSKFADHFLSMRPFKCLEGPDKLWCRVPYPYENRRDLSGGDLTDLEYDLLFVWKPSGAYGVDLWNGVYYRLTKTDGRIEGVMHEVDLEPLGVPPEAGELRPITPDDLTEAEPEGHWLPRLVIE